MAAAGESTPEVSDISKASDFPAFRGRVEALVRLCADLRNFYGQSNEESKKFLDEYITDLKRRSEDIESESFVQYLSGIEDIGAYLDHKREELEKIRTANFSLSDEISCLTKGFDEEFLQFQNGLAYFDSLSEDRNSSVPTQVSSGNLLERLNKQESLSMQENCHFEVLALEGLIEKRKVELDCIEDLKSMFKRVEAISQVEEVLCHAKVIEFKDNCIWISLKTFLPTTRSPKYQFYLEKMIGPSVVHHEMLIKISGTREVVDVEIFPNDVPIDDIANEIKSARTDVSCPLSFLKIRSKLEWVVRKVQQRIHICNLRQLILKDANRSRHKFEYSVDGAITTRLAGGIEASIMVPESWPMSDSALRLLSLKNLNFHSKDVSVRSLHKLKELANSLDTDRRYNLLNFVEAIEEILEELVSSDNL
ncbi:unnamed protein product [Victoria cruziana]